MDHFTENLENKSDSSTDLMPSNPSATVSEFSSGPQQIATFRTVDDNVTDEEDNESSEDEDYDHSEHFYQIAKRQYEDILARDPTNAEIKEKLAALVYAHDYSNKRQKTK